MTVALVPQELDLGPLLPAHLSEIIAGLILMVLIYIVFAKIVSPKFEAMYQQRAAAIEGGIARAEQAEAEAAQARAEFTRQLDEANAQAARVREEAKNQGAVILAQMREEANREAERAIEAAREQIEAERRTSMNQLSAEVGAMATTLASRILGESLSDDERAARAVDRFLAELAETPAKNVETV